MQTARPYGIPERTECLTMWGRLGREIPERTEFRPFATPWNQSGQDTLTEEFPEPKES